MKNEIVNMFTVDILATGDNIQTDVSDFAQLFKDVQDLTYSAFEKINREKSLGFDTFLLKLKNEGVLQ